MTTWWELWTSVFHPFLAGESPEKFVFDGCLICQTSHFSHPCICQLAVWGRPSLDSEKYRPLALYPDASPTHSLCIEVPRNGKRRQRPVLNLVSDRPIRYCKGEKRWSRIVDIAIDSVVCYHFSNLSTMYSNHKLVNQCNSCMISNEQWTS